jgi:hypothetical protein
MTPSDRVQANEQKGEYDVEVSPNHDQRIVLKNLFNTHLQYSPLPCFLSESCLPASLTATRYVTKSITRFFEVECPEQGWITSKYITHSFPVRPNLAAIRANLKLLMKVPQAVITISV